MSDDRQTVDFTRMDQGTAEEYAMLGRNYERLRAGTADAVLELLFKLRGDRLGYRIDRFEHSLQTATRAQRDGADEETVVCALLHDVGDTVAPDNHSQVAAAILRPYVSEKNHWIVEHHGLFQGYYYFHHVGLDRNARDRHRGHAWSGDCEAFCERWDQMSFDPDYDTLPFEHFEPMVRRLFQRRAREFV